MARARAFIEVNEFEFAIKDLKLVKMMHPEYEPVER